jgi:hypothetical protein
VQARRSFYGFSAGRSEQSESYTGERDEPHSKSGEAHELDCEADREKEPQGAGCDTGAVEYLPEPRGSLALIVGAGFVGFLYRRRST